MEKFKNALSLGELWLTELPAPNFSLSSYPVILNFKAWPLFSFHILVLKQHPLLAVPLFQIQNAEAERGLT